MYLMKPVYLLLLILAVCMMSCGLSQTKLPQTNAPSKTAAFDGYWYNGKAEISSYELRQARYGQIHQGSATQIFVTEPFNTSKQVKADNAMAPDVVSVLKLNQTRKFTAGIYPYSTMTSTFTPVNTSEATSSLKVTNSVQEWCGQVFIQMNKKEDSYDMKRFSYFETEGDTRETIESTFLEDEMFNLIRINPEGLPIGEVSCLPSLVYLSFMHRSIKPYSGYAVKKDTIITGISATEYSIQYRDLDRVIKVQFSNSFPFKILGWEESYSSYNGQALKTEAILKNTKLIDYWNKNNIADSIYYQQLFDF